MLSKQNNLIEDAPQKLVDELIGLYNNGQSKTVLEKSIFIKAISKVIYGMEHSWGSICSNRDVR